MLKSLSSKEVINCEQHVSIKKNNKYKHIKYLFLKILIFLLIASCYAQKVDKRKFSIRAGNEKLQQQIEAGVLEEDIRKSWVNEVREFKKMRKPYLIYNEI